MSLRVATAVLALAGVAIAGYLQQSGGAHHVHKVATLAAPFQGAFEAVAQITTGTANLAASYADARSPCFHTT